MILLLKIFLAHFVGDFLLQPYVWVKAKEEKKIRAWQLYAHSLLHGLLVVLFVWDWSFWPWALLITVVHLVIDASKIMLNNAGNQRALFFIDQVLHYISIYLIWLWYEGMPLPFFIFESIEGVAFITAIIMLTNPISFAVKIFISKWTPHTEKTEDDALQSAGKYIGIFERLFIFTFILLGEWQGVGFLLAAKSIFRFGDLKESKDRKLTEYIMIGTLLSFGLAILTALLYQFVTHIKFFQ